MKILALDPATNTGIAYGDTTFWAPMTALWDLSTRRDESMGMKLLRLEAKLEEFKGRVDLVVFENVAQSKFAKALIHQSRLQAIIVRWCEVNNVNYKPYAPKEIKKFATGNGNAGKPEMVKAARERFFYAGEDNNEADALCLAHLAFSEYGRAA